MSKEQRPTLFYPASFRETHKKTSSPIPTVVGAGIAGGLEMGLFYMPEVVARRLQTNKNVLVQKGFKPGQVLHNIKVAVLTDPSKSFSRQLVDLNAGLAVATGYKIAQRMYKIAGQKIAKEELDSRFGDFYRTSFGDRNGKLLLEATAGMLVGIGEAPILLPLDAIKIRYQTNKRSVAGQNIITLMRNEGLNLYRGLSWTVGRNAVGSAAFFWVNAAMKEYVIKAPEDVNGKVHTTVAEKLLAASAASAASIVIPSPADVVRTRLLSGKEKTTSGLAIARDMLRKEGSSAFFKGAIVKTGTQGSKVAFAFTVAETIADKVSDTLTLKR